MKAPIIFLMTLFSLNAFAYECNTYEAQVVGEVTKVTMNQDTCHYEVELIEFRSHVFCPLTAAEIAVEGVHGKCSLEVGEGFASILVKGTDGIINFD